MKLEIGLLIEDDTIDAIAKCIRYALNVRKDITDLTDYNSKDAYEQVVDMTANSITKTDWMDMISLAAKDMTSSDDKAYEKAMDKIEGILTSTQIKQKFLTHGMSLSNDIVGDEFTGSEDSDMAIGEFLKDDELSRLFKESVQNKIEINDVKRRLIDQTALTVYYITDGAIEKDDFKVLLDAYDVHQSDIMEDPKAPKLFTLFNKFNIMYRLCKEFQPDILSSYSKEFGLDISLKPVEPNDEHISFWKEKNINRWS